MSDYQLALQRYVKRDPGNQLLCLLLIALPAKIFQSMITVLGTLFS